MALAVRNGGTSFIQPATSGTVNISYTLGDILVLHVGASRQVASPLPSITSVTDTHGLTWAQRGTTQSQVIGSNNYASFIYWAYANSTQASSTLTINFAASTYAVYTWVDVQNFTGSAYITNPWDTNASLPGVNTATTSSAPTVTISTDGSVSDMMLGFLTGTGNVNSPPSGWTIIGTPNTAAGQVNEGSEYKVVSTPQSSVAVGMTTASGSWIMMADALAIPPPPPFTPIGRPFVRTQRETMIIKTGQELHTVQRRILGLRDIRRRKYG